ncbi:cyclic AMP-dependent transcription factor ATF-4-like [Carassius auratus]|uniref:Cyclic AMP-dependent transcription factor ATF-4 n=1 Tax=Carassius auratus TaxID=7957 RepID=A0A6P6JUA9_CARAU|nr:cyclic AMP-dependent transcription factor ATF-4-like [Carassius auratus]XP_052408729.1 activating transcription factor 4b [Carassius gibelio]
MSLMSSRFGPDDMEALLWDPSSPMADPLGSFLDKDEEVLTLRGTESPLSSFSSSPLPSLSPPCTPPSLQRGEKAGLNPLSLSWFSSDELCLDNGGADSSNDHSFSEMDWMTERIDLSEFDLESLIDSYDSEDPPSSPEEFIASLESQIDLESQSVALNNAPSPGPQVSVPEIDQLSNLAFTLSTPVSTAFIPSTPCEVSDSSSVVPEPQAELEIKSEPASPLPSPSILSPESPTDTLELGCEVDIAEVQSPTPVEMRVPKIVLSLSPTRIVLVLAPKEEANLIAAHPVELVVENPPSPASPDPQTPASPQSRSGRVNPYHVPDSKPTQNQQSKSPSLTGRVKSASGSKVVVEKKKLKKMEQNKTAATRYRQKKRAEQESLQSECTALEERNQELADKAESLTKEIQYLKELMDEVKRARESRNMKS